MMVRKSKSYAYILKSSNRCKGFTEVNTLNLGVALSHKACFVSDDLSMFIKLVAEDPLCPDDIVDVRIRSFDQFLDIIKLELKKFILHSLNPFNFLNCLKYFFRL